jgi:hypothetical protein
MIQYMNFTIERSFIQPKCSPSGPQKLRRSNQKIFGWSNDNFLITLLRLDSYSGVVVVLCVAAKEATQYGETQSQWRRQY